MILLSQDFSALIHNSKFFFSKMILISQCSWALALVLPIVVVVVIIYLFLSQDSKYLSFNPTENVKFSFDFIGEAKFF